MSSNELTDSLPDQVATIIVRWLSIAPAVTVGFDAQHLAPLSIDHYVVASAGGDSHLSRCPYIVKLVVGCSRLFPPGCSHFVGRAARDHWFRLRSAMAAEDFGLGDAFVVLGACGSADGVGAYCPRAAAWLVELAGPCPGHLDFAPAGLPQRIEAVLMFLARIIGTSGASAVPI